MEVRKICIGCPVGCRLEIRGDRDHLDIQGNRCRKGAKYAANEIRDPRRTVTAVALTDQTDGPCCPVKSDRPVPVGMIDKLLDRVYALRVTLPVRCGDRLIENFAGTGVNVVFTRSMAVPAGKKSK